MSLDFQLVSDFVSIQRRSFPATDPTILDPTNANPLVLGEWLELDNSYQVQRGTGTGATVPSWAVFAERGRFDVQALGKLPMLYLVDYEADTKVMDPTSLVVGSPLMVTNVTYGALTRRGLALQSGGAYIVGRVTRTPAQNNGFLRFITKY